MRMKGFSVLSGSLTGGIKWAYHIKAAIVKSVLPSILLVLVRCEPISCSGNDPRCLSVTIGRQAGLENMAFNISLKNREVAV